jgi:ATP-dependent exoDNAse (exonuclease V) beta subunit
VERTWAALGGPACLAKDDDLQDAGDYLDLLERHASAGDLADFDGFRSRVEDLFAQPDSSADGRLQLLTMHKAKGLQFETVIVPGLGRRPRRDSPALLLSAERPQPDGSVDRLLATIRETGKDQDPVYGYLRVLEQQKNVHESVRLLYVAATRARTRLHLIGHAMRSAKGEVRPQGGSLLDRLWSGLRDEERQRFRDRFESAGVEAEAAALAAGVPLRRLPLTWTAPPPPAPVAFDAAEEVRTAKPSYLWVGDQLRHVGTVVHAALERIASGRPEAGSYRSALANLGAVPSELEEAARRVEEAVSRTLASQRGRWILSAHAEARCEYAIAGVVDGEIVHGTIDRTFVDSDGTRWIIDYKTSVHAGGDLDFFLDEEERRYRPQLERYARLLAPAGRPIKLGLYFPLLDAWRELQCAI